MTFRDAPRVLSIPPGAPFLRTLVDAFLGGEIVAGFSFEGDPLALAEATFYVPTRRAARELRGVFVDRMGGRSAILPTIRPLGEFDEDGALFEAGGSAVLDLAPAISEPDRLLLLAPLVQAWRSRLPGHVAGLFEEGVVVPASAGDAIWLARDLAGLMDEIETEDADWTRLNEIVPDDLAGWWQVTLDFLCIVTEHWPGILEEVGRSNPAAHRNALIAAESERLVRARRKGPVVAAGSTGTIPATARLLAAIARLPQGAVVLPGLDLEAGDEAWDSVGAAVSPSAFGHPQFGLKKLLNALGVTRRDVAEIGTLPPALAARRAVVSDAMRPPETTDTWAQDRGKAQGRLADDALAGVSLVEAANEQDEALAVAVALRRAIDSGERTAALVTPNRDLARRVASELRRFGIEADDSAGTLLSQSTAATLAELTLAAVFRPGDPVPIVGLLKHPLLRLGMSRAEVRHAAETIELIALRGGVGRPDVAELAALFERRHAELATTRRKPFWFGRIDRAALSGAREVLRRLADAVSALAWLRNGGPIAFADAAIASVRALEALGRGEDGSLSELYSGDAGEALVAFLRNLVASPSTLVLEAGEWPDVFAAMIATETVKPPVSGDPRVAIWGTLEARLQSVDTVVLGGLNEGTWPRVPASDRFLSRLMKRDIALEPPERRIGLAAHDFMMAMGSPEVVLSRAARAGDAPAVASRWLQRLLAYAGSDEALALRRRGAELTAWARALDAAEKKDFAPRPEPKPPLEDRPTRFSVTEIETLRRDPYAVYAKRILLLDPLDPLVTDPGAAERGTLFHDILHRFSVACPDPAASGAMDELVAIGRQAFRDAGLPADVEAVWWPRFERMAPNVIEWELERADGVLFRHAEARAEPFAVGATGATLSGYADRIDVRSGSADILDYKTGSSPSKGQAHTLLAPQLALEAALLQRGAFTDIAAMPAAELAYVRLRANGRVEEESILTYDRRSKTGPAIAGEAWSRLGELLTHYGNPNTGYKSRALPFREGDMDGNYDHLARVLEWSAGGEDAEDNGDPA